MATPRTLTIRASHSKDWYMTNVSHNCLAFPLKGEDYEMGLAFLKAAAIEGSACCRQKLATARSIGGPRDPRAHSHILPKPKNGDSR